MWTLFLLMITDPDPAPGEGEAVPAIEYECPEDLDAAPDLIRRKCREAMALQAQPSPGGGTRPVIILPAAAAAAAGIAIGGMKGDPPVSR